MSELLKQWFPHVMEKPDLFLTSLTETLIMVGWAGGFMFLFGLFFGIVLTVTKEGGVLACRPVYQVLDKIINLFRSIPFIILLTALMPLSRLIMGTAIYVRGVIVPLVFGATPFFSRQVESALAQTDKGLIEAALSMGSSPFEIIFRVYLRESVAPIVRAVTITTISLLGLTAMAGAVGAGGLGDFAIRYGHDRNMVDITWVTVIVLVIAVSIVQWLGDRLARKHTH